MENSSNTRTVMEEDEIRSVLENFGDEEDVLSSDGDDLGEEDCVEVQSDDSADDPDYDYENDMYETDDEEDITMRVQQNIQRPTFPTAPTMDALPSTSRASPPTASQQTGKGRRGKRRRSTAAEDVPEKIIRLDGDSVLGRNGTFSWSTKPVMTGNAKTPSKNVVHIRHRSKDAAADVSTPLESFDVFFTSDMLEVILSCTNAEISLQRLKYRKPDSSILKDLEMIELRAFLGVLILCGANKDNHKNVKYLFDPRMSGTKYIAAFSMNRFRFLLNCLRFDNRETRSERVKKNKLALISDIWERLIQNCQRNYEPSAYLTLDEQLVPFRGKCSFRMFIPNKPAKYGLKIVMLCDQTTNYMYNAIPYVGKGSTPPGVPAAKYITETIVSVVRGTNRNITMDNWFTSLPLSQTLLDEFQLTMVGTVRKNKPELPSDFVNPKFKHRQPGSSLFIHAENITAVSYAPKTSRVVTLLSTMHDDEALAQSGKPEIISCYNQTKGAVDAFDQCCHNSNIIRRTKRWPQCFFFNMLNIACYNAYVIYLQNFYKSSAMQSRACSNSTSRRRSKPSKPLPRFEFLVQLADELMKPWLGKRLEQRIPKDVRSSIEKILNITPTIFSEEPHSNDREQVARKYCTFCPSKKKRMSKMRCSHCKKPICGQHEKKLCVVCHLDNFHATA